MFGIKYGVWAVVINCEVKSGGVVEDCGFSRVGLLGSSVCWSRGAHGAGEQVCAGIKVRDVRAEVRDGLKGVRVTVGDVCGEVEECWGDKPNVL